MTIKSIEQTNHDCALLVLAESGEKLKIPAYLLVQFSLATGMELSDETWQELKKACAKENCRQRAVRILSQTAVSEKELQKRLIQKGETAEDAAQTVSWLKELKLLDDEKTAQMLVQTAARKGYGKKRIESILYEKSIPRELWENALSELPQTDDAIDGFLHQKLDGKTIDQKLLQKVTQALIRRGFSWSEIREAISRYREGLPCPEDFA